MKSIRYVFYIISCVFRVDNDFKPCIMLIIETTKRTRKGLIMNTNTKAENVQQAYDAASWERYVRAVEAAQNLGGVETTNDDNISGSFAPTRIFEFDDASAVYVSLGGVFVY